MIVVGLHHVHRILDYRKVFLALLELLLRTLHSPLNSRQRVRELRVLLLFVYVIRRRRPRRHVSAETRHFPFANTRGDAIYTTF
jgi:hypothetical protein